MSKLIKNENGAAVAEAPDDLFEIKAEFDALAESEQATALAELSAPELHRLICATVAENAREGLYDEAIPSCCLISRQARVFRRIRSFHFRFSICHVSLAAAGAPANDRWQIKNAIWKIELPQQFCLTV